MNPRVALAEPSVIRALNARRNAASIDLGLGEPALLPDAGLFEDAARWVARNGCRYSPNAGFPELGAAIARHYAYPLMLEPGNVCIMNGSQEAVFCAIKALLDPACDELLIVEPSFPVYRKIAEVEGVAVRGVSMREDANFAFDPELILDAIGPKTRMIMLCSPCNPTGAVITRDACVKIAAALDARPGPPVYVVHDEIYRELLFTDDAGWFGEFYGNTIAINSLSKSNALTGLRLGWVIAAAPESAAIAKVHAWTTSCAGTFAQRIALAVFERNALTAHRAWYADRRSAVLAAARESGLPFIEPDGSFYLCVRPGGKSLDLAVDLADRYNTITIPGSIFGAGFEGWLRLTWVGALDDLRSGLKHVAQAAAG